MLFLSKHLSQATGLEFSIVANDILVAAEESNNLLYTLDNASSQIKYCHSNHLITAWFHSQSEQDHCSGSCAIKPL